MRELWLGLIAGTLAAWRLCEQRWAVPPSWHADRIIALTCPFHTPVIFRMPFLPHCFSKSCA